MLSCLSDHSNDGIDSLESGILKIKIILHWPFSLHYQPFSQWNHDSKYFFIIYEVAKCKKQNSICVHICFHTGMQRIWKKIHQGFNNYYLWKSRLHVDFFSSFCLSVIIFVKTISICSFFILKRKYNLSAVGPITLSLSLAERITKGDF